MKVALFDYGAGNLHSLAKALAAPGVEIVIEEDARRLTEADAVVLPGVGAFAAAAARLAPGRDALVDALRAGMPGLGICLGMQLLFEGSDELIDMRSDDVAGDAAMMADRGNGGIVDAGGGPRREAAGLALIAGRVSRLHARRVPQIGWNTLETPPTGARDPLLERAELDVAYYANSFACRATDDGVVRAWSEHDGDRFAAVVRAHRTVGVQFHPEKSSAPGVRFVHAWLDEARERAR